MSSYVSEADPMIGHRRITFVFSKSLINSIDCLPDGLPLGADIDTIDATIVPTKLSKSRIGRARMDPTQSAYPFRARPSPLAIFGRKSIAGLQFRPSRGKSYWRHPASSTRPEKFFLPFLRAAFSPAKTGLITPSPGVEKTGFEPATPCLQSRCSTN